MPDRRTIVVFAAGLVMMACARWSKAQPQPPPFLGGGTAFDPEVGVVQSGALLDAQATVSADRRYVTITTGTDNSRLLDLTLFPVQQTNFGFVGGVDPTGQGARARVEAVANSAQQRGSRAQGPGPAQGAISSSPLAIANRASVLNRRGMFLLAPLK
jgi:hypothetical protein